MTQPTVIYFGPDAVRYDASFKPRPALPKIYLRTLLFSTSKRGRVVESIHVSLSRNETHQNFNIWVYGEDKLVRGSGLFVGESGITANHHFLAPNDVGHTYRFVAGTYRLDVFAKLLGENKRKQLFTQSLEVSQESAALLDKPGNGLYFDWGPDASRYQSHIDFRQPPPEIEQKIPGLFGPRTTDES